MRTRERMTVTVDKVVLSEAKELLKNTGITLSGFIDITLRGLVDSQAKPMRQMYEDMAVAMMRKVTKPHGKAKRLT